LRRTSLWTTDL